MMAGLISWKRANGLWKQTSTGTGGRPEYSLFGDSSGYMYWDSNNTEWRIYFDDVQDNPTLYRTLTNSTLAPATGWELVHPAPVPRITRDADGFAIKGCGHARVNGEWTQERIRRGRPVYTRVGDPNTTIYWSVSRSEWSLYFAEGTPTTMYKSSETSHTVPTSGWVAVHDPTSQ